MAVRSAPRSHISRKRIKIAFWIILLCYLALVGRLIYLQGLHGEEIRAEAIKARRATLTLHAGRGTIYDRDGKPLAISLYSGTVGFDPHVLQVEPGDKRAATLEQDLNGSIRRVASILNMPVEQIEQIVRDARAKYNPKKPLRFVPIKKEVAWETAQLIRAPYKLTDDAKAKPKRLLGFGVADGSQRVYASSRNAAQVIGFLKPGADKGAAGLEYSFDRYLKGKDGSAKAELDNNRRAIPNTITDLKPAQDGLDVHTTLDPTVQSIAMEEAQRIYEKYSPVGVSIVVLEPNTGDVLGMVSCPTFDPNPTPPGQPKPAITTPEALQQRYAAQWERCTTCLYEPGSTVKALTVAAALENRDISLSSHFYCGGHITVNNRTIKCDHHSAADANGHGSVTPLDILRVSCNIGAAEIGMKMHPMRLYAAMDRFGLRENYALGLPQEKKGVLSYGNEKINTNAKAARVAFGHAIQTTPLHVANAYAAIANGGHLMRPRLVTKITDAKGRVRFERKSEEIRRVLSDETSAEVVAMLRSVVSNGTGKIAAVPHYQVAGKTGTAHKYKPGKYAGSFAGFLPASPNVKPRAVVLVVVDEPKGAYYGADVAAPAFQSIAKRLMETWHVSEDDPTNDQWKVAQDGLRRAGKLPAIASNR